MAIPIGAMTGRDRKRIEAVAVSTRIHLANAKVNNTTVSVKEMLDDASRVVEFYNHKEQ